MEQNINKKDILNVWHAFSNLEGIKGWRSIALGKVGRVSIIAGCKFPEKEEYIAFGFSNYQFPPNSKYPQSKGFYVMHKDNILGDTNTSWLVILKNRQAGTDLFLSMIDDLLNTMKRLTATSEYSIFNNVIKRIKLWQNFLSKSLLPILSPEKEMGLLGELCFLNELLSYLDHEEVLNSWKGPLDEPKDFILGEGGVEVKSTVSNKQFKVKIVSLEQLNTTTVKPLFLAGYRFELNNIGNSINHIINDIKNLLKNNAENLSRFESLLINYGYIEIFSSEYTRNYLLKEKIFCRVESDFPRITEENVMNGVINVKYEIDITNHKEENFDEEKILKELGVI